MSLERFDTQSFQRVLSKTERSPSPDHPGAIRCTVTLPWGEVFMQDYAEWGKGAAEGWFGTVKGLVDAHYNKEDAQPRKRVDRGEGSGTGSSGGEEPASEPAVEPPQEGVEEREPPRAASAPQASGGDAGWIQQLPVLIRGTERRIRELESELREALRELTTYQAAAAALEVFDGSENDKPTSDGVHRPEREASDGVGGADEARPDGR